MNREGDDPSSWREEDAYDAGLSDPANRRRQATIFDAVSGKLSNKNDRPGRIAAAADTLYSTREMPYAPDEVLFRRRDAPQRYEEHDIYASHARDLPRAGQGVLPESDLLKAVHAYASRYYGSLHHHRRAAEEEGPDDGGGAAPDVNERSMDETALLAFGILLEEAGRDVLGRRGDLVFTEGITGPAAGGGGPTTAGEAAPRFVVPREAAAVDDQDSEGRARSSRKKRRVMKDEDTW